jgi:hypothetical protein
MSAACKASEDLLVQLAMEMEAVAATDRPSVLADNAIKEYALWFELVRRS